MLGKDILAEELFNHLFGEKNLNKIKLLRLSKGMSQQDLARDIGISENKVSKLETDRLKLSEELAELIAVALQTSVEELSNDEQRGARG